MTSKISKKEVAGNCTECYADQPRLWRDQPMNPVIKERLTHQRHANQYYFTLDEAMTVWGQEINDVPD